MADCKNGFNLKRKYVQINNLVIDNYDMLISASLNRPTKWSEIPFYSSHGSHVGLYGKEILAHGQSLSLSLSLDVRKLGRQDRELYKRFVLMNLTTHGKIWAIEGHNLIWTYAVLTNQPEIYDEDKNTVSLDVDLFLPLGYWVEADSRTVFFAEYDITEWNWNFCLSNNQLCRECNCPCGSSNFCGDCSCCYDGSCEAVNVDNSLCVRGWDALRTFIDDCQTRYRIVEDLTARDKLWDEYYDRYDFNHCRECSDTCIIATRFTGQTTMNTHRVELVLDGEFNDPEIRFNDLHITIRGEFRGRLIIDGNLTVKYIPEDSCNNEGIILNFSDLTIHSKKVSNLYVQQGHNSVIIEAGTTADNCVRVRYRPITI